MKKSDKTKKTNNIYETRREAFRAAKRDQGVPMGTHPWKVANQIPAKGKLTSWTTGIAGYTFFAFCFPYLDLMKRKKKKSTSGKTRKPFILPERIRISILTPEKNRTN